MKFTLEPNKELVIIKADEVDAERNGIPMSDLEKKNAMKQINKGKVIVSGSLCAFAKTDDYVSFYRNAATSITENEVEYLIINEAHILCKLVSNEE